MGLLCMLVPWVFSRNPGSAFPEVTKLQLEETPDPAGTGLITDTWGMTRAVRTLVSRDPCHQWHGSGGEPCHTSPFVPSSFFFLSKGVETQRMSTVGCAVFSASATECGHTIHMHVHCVAQYESLIGLWYLSRHLWKPQKQLTKRRVSKDWAKVKNRLSGSQQIL